MRVHFIAIGGAIMHNLAMALHNKGYRVTGSDDEIFEPSKTRLQKYGLLPERTGWHADNIHPDLDAVILGMHALEDNPELKKAIDLGIKVYSFPSFMYEQTKNKKRIVVAGSHGKTTITSMILHVLKVCNKKFDYLVGSQIDGFETMVGINEDSEVAIFEGDEYLTSPLDRVPKFYHYRPHMAILSGIAWDHFNVFPTFENYLDQFRLLTQRMEPGGQIFYDGEDENIKLLNLEQEERIKYYGYGPIEYETTPKGSLIKKDKKEYILPVFGRHNMKNTNAARIICHDLGIGDDMFFSAMTTFTGAKRRLETILDKEGFTAFNDFAHAPSKVKATLAAVREKYPDRKVIAFLELHTFSSLNKNFLPQYANALNDADEAIVFFNEEVLKNKKLSLGIGDVKQAFNRNDIIILTKKEELIKNINGIEKNNSVIIFMSSGNFSGADLKSLVNNLYF